MNTLKERRMASGYSCRQMAMKLNISKTFYWKIENDKRRMSYDIAVKIADVFKLKPDDLFYEQFKSKET